MVSNSFKNKLSNLIRKNKSDRGVKTKKQLSFYVRIYIKVEDSPYKTKTQTLKRNQPVYVQDIDTGKYFYKDEQYKLFSFKSYFFKGNTKNIKPYIHQPVFGSRHNDYVKFKLALSKYKEYYDDFISNEGNWLSYLPSLLFVVEDVDYEGNGVNLGEINYEEEMASDDFSSIKLSTSYIHYNFDEIEKAFSSVYTSEYIRKNFIPRACWYSLIIDIFKAPIEKYYKNTKITYGSLYEMINPNSSFDENDLATNFKSVVNGFFRPFRIAIYLFDSNIKRRVHYDPKDEGRVRNTHIFPQVIYVMLHNNHVTRLNENLNSLCQKLDSFSLENDLILQPHTYYSLPKDKNDRKLVIVEDYDHLLSLLEEKVDIEAIYNDDLFELWKRIFNDHKYECDMSFSGSFITCLNINNINNTKIRISNLYSISAGSIEIWDNSVYESFTNAKNKFVTKLLNQNYLSRYSPQANEIFHYYKRGGIIGGLKKYIKDANVVCLDYNKYYTSILMGMPQVPVTNVFDDFVKYNGEPIQDMSIYKYVKLDNKITYPLSRHGTIFGCNIKKYKPNIKILEVLKPSKLKENKSKVLIEELYNNKDLTIDMKKYIVNQAIGMKAKKYNQKCYSKAFTCEKEAYSNLERYGGNVIRRNLNDYVEIDRNMDLPCLIMFSIPETGES